MNLDFAIGLDRDPSSVMPGVAAVALAGRAGAERALAELATGQHGVVSRAQLTALGFGRRSIEHRIACGRLHRIHRGVYLVGHRAPPPLAPEMAAALAGGAGALVSFTSAGSLLRLGGARPEIVEISIPGRTPSARTDLRVHRTDQLPDDERTTHRGIPITSPARTLLDLASRLTERDLRWTVEEARIARVARPSDLRAIVARHPGRRGAARLRAAVEEAFGEPAITRSEAERRLHDLIRQAGLPRPRANVRLHGWSVDCHWPEQGLVAEIDGFAYHATRSAFERDRRKDAALQAAGLRVVRVSWRQVTREAVAVAALLARLLER